ncbi:MAG: EamA family transporter RarD [Piscinibacter sp.]|uniref:EamA family transporter RarD n=1 Tax=Piscinibacter sp. TaxID=1903157 RepID=UPI002585A1FA|nr:EamA family transporter RarD [Piscinibacter sp.]MCW5663274.1 EamA family transporter RarD [Piscinibacter sp.]
MPPGIAYAALAYTLWGLFPLYFTRLQHVAASEVLVHRIVWSLAFVLALLAWRQRWSWLPDVLRRPRVLGAFAASALLLSCNWLTYIWAVTNGHVLDASLGYFITPLVNVALGYWVLHERPRAAQWAALALATLGVLWLTVQTGQVPWIALVLAASFGAYGLLRKIAVLGALEGLALETLLLAPPALVLLVLWWGRGPASFPAPDLATNLWLLGVGPLTAVPLLLFAAGARRIPMTTLGLLQYIGPSIQFVLGVWLFGEPFGGSRLAGFVLIWAALLLYSADGWRVARRAAA